MAYWQSLIKSAEKNGVGRASRRYNRNHSYIYFCHRAGTGLRRPWPVSRRLHYQPKEHAEAELKLIQDVRRRSPTPGLNEFWSRLRRRGYTRRPESLYRVIWKLGMLPVEKKKPPYTPKPYEQMTFPVSGSRWT